MLKRMTFSVLFIMLALASFVGTASAQKTNAKGAKKAMPAVAQRAANPDKAGTIREIFVKVQLDPSVKWTPQLGALEDKIVAAIARISPTKYAEFSPCDGKRDGTLIVKVSNSITTSQVPCGRDGNRLCSEPMLSNYLVTTQVYVWDDRTGQSTPVGSFDKLISLQCTQVDGGNIAGSGIWQLGRQVNGAFELKK